MFVVVLMDSVTALEPFAGGVTELALSVQVIPLVVGQPDDIVRVTGELNPPSESMFTWALPELPCWIVNEDGVAEILKSGVAGAMLNDPMKVVHDPLDVLG